MPATVTHALSMTTPFNALFENNATNWNSAHAVTFNVVATEISQLFSNANGVSFGLDGTNITATVQTNYLTTAMASNRGSDFVQATAAFAGTNASGTIASDAISVSVARPAFSADASSTFQTLTFQDSNGVSFSNNAGALRVTHALQFTSNTSAITSNAMHSTSRPAFSADASSTFQTLSLQNSNGISFSNNAGAVRLTHDLQFTSATSAITSAALHTSAAFRAVYDGANSVSTGTLRFTNANGVSFSINGQTISGSVAAQTNQTLGLYMSSNTTSSVSSGTVDARSLTFRGMGLASVGYSGGEVVVSVPAGAPSPVNFSAGTTSGDLASVVFSNANGVSFGLDGSTITAQHNAITTARASTDGIGLATAQTNVTWTVNSAGLSLNASGYAGTGTTFNGANLSASMTVNSAGVQLSMSAAAAGGGATLSAWQPYADALWVTSGIGNASLWINPKEVQQAFQYDRFVMPMQFSQATNSTLTVSNTVAWGWYTKNGNSLSLYKSGSGTFSINGSGTNSSGENSGIRAVSLASTDTITAGNYYLGVVWRSTTAGNNASLSHIAISQWASTLSGYLGIASNTRMNMHIGGGGVWTSTTAGPVPNSLAFSDIRGNSSAFHRQPIVFFTSGNITF